LFHKYPNDVVKDKEFLAARHKLQVAREKLAARHKLQAAREKYVH
jgi:hypothetical protein